MSECTPPPDAVAVAVRSLSVRFGEVRALDGLDLTCLRGQILAVIGPNGAGKSTLVYALADLVRPASGEVELLGRHYDKADEAVWIRRRTGFLLSEDALFDYLTGAEFLDFLAESYGLGTEAAERGRELAALLELDPYLERVVVGYSRGNRRKLAIIGALIHDPELIILDEPFESLDPMSVVHLREHLASLAKRGRAVLITSHLLAVLERIADNVLVIHQGRAHVAGSVEAVRAQLGEGPWGSALEAVFKRVVEPGPPA